MDWKAPWPRLLLWTSSRVLFSALPLVMNALVWFLVRRAAVWQPFQLEDLCYFVILLASETILGLCEYLQTVSTFRILLLCLLMFAGLGAATLLGLSHHQAADPRVDPFTGETEAQRMLIMAAVIASGTLVIGATVQFALPRHDPAAVPKLGLWLAGRILSAHLPVLFSIFFWFLTTPTTTPYMVFRVNDLCFLAVALASPAIMDLVSGTSYTSIPRTLTVAPLLLIVITASLVLGCWYFTSARPPEPGIQGALATNLLYVAAVSAIGSIIAAVLVNWQLHQRGAEVPL